MDGLQYWRGDLADEKGPVGEITGQTYPFKGINEIIKWCQKEKKKFWEVVSAHEDPSIWAYLDQIWHIMVAAIAKRDPTPANCICPAN